MIFIENSCKQGDSTSKGPSKTFVGDVYLNLIHTDEQNVIADVTFTPCARTNWHTHEGGQLIVSGHPRKPSDVVYSSNCIYVG